MLPRVYSETDIRSENACSFDSNHARYANTEKQGISEPGNSLSTWRPAKRPPALIADGARNLPPKSGGVRHKGAIMGHT